MLIAGVELDSDDVLWLATELIVTGHSDTAEVLLVADDEDTDMTLTVIQRDTLLQVLDDPPQRLAQLRAALLDEQTWVPDLARSRAHRISRLAARTQIHRRPPPLTLTRCRVIVRCPPAGQVVTAAQKVGWAGRHPFGDRPAVIR